MDFKYFTSILSSRISAIYFLHFTLKSGIWYKTKEIVKYILIKFLKCNEFKAAYC